MEDLIALILIGIVVGYLIYQYLRSRKYKKAKKLFVAKDYKKAAKILNKILNKHLNAPQELADCYLKLGQEESNRTHKTKYFFEVTAIRTKIKKIESLIKFEKIETKALFEIAKIQYEEAEGNIEKLNKNILFIDSANKKGSENDFSTLKTEHFSDLAICHFTKATKKERSSKHSEIINAIQSYRTAKDYAVKSNNNKILNNSVARITICKLKLCQTVSLTESPEIKYSDKNYQHELYYRYATKLIKSKKYLEAEEIISSHLNFDSPEIDNLREILNTEKNNTTVKTITDINTSIDKLYNNDLSTEELKSLYDSLDKASDEVSVLDKQLSQKISDIKPTLFNRLLTRYIKLEKYEDAIEIIQKYPKFWEIPELLKNLGLCCFGLTSKGLLTDSNYQIVISGWLSSVFSDRVILKSLDNTTWDDNYTFTLLEAIGSSFSHHEEVPDNVNYDLVSEKNISIGETQKELLQQFESIIHKEIKDANLSKLVNDFYDNEKEAIEKIITIINNDIFFSTPYFAKSNGLHNEIIKELDKHYQIYSNEDALEAGVPYVVDSDSTIVYQYFHAYDLIEKVKSASTCIGMDFRVRIKILDQSYKRHVEKFEKIKNSLEDLLYNIISKKITDNNKNEKIILIMQECISFSYENDKLKHQYSNYVSNYCISKVNDGEFDYFKALSLMKDAYLYSPNNPKIVRNFITLIRFNLLDILNDNTIKTNEIYSISDWTKNNMSLCFKQNNSELRKAREDMLQQLKQADVDISLFDTNSILNIDFNLGSSLNAEGLKMKKILYYLKELGKEQKNIISHDSLRPLNERLNLEDDLPL